MPGPWKRPGPPNLMESPTELSKGSPWVLVWAVLAWIMFFTAVLLLALIAWANPLKAHAWYDAACCSDRDCKPVDDGVVAEKADGVHVQGHGILSRTDSRLRMSRDDRDHLCVPSYDKTKLLCVYRKPNGM
jgi:hypothetical protein